MMGAAAKSYPWSDVGQRSAAAARGEPRWVRAVLLAASLAIFSLFLLLPLVCVFYEALRNGLGAYLAALVEPDALAAIRLTLLTVAVVVPLNVAFGLAAAWAISKFDFRGKYLLITLIDLPFSISPVVSGLV
jgi:sulfate/thiosulfate transport system permease protein